MLASDFVAGCWATILNLILGKPAVGGWVPEELLLLGITSAGGLDKGVDLGSSPGWGHGVITKVGILKLKMDRSPCFEVIMGGHGATGDTETKSRARGREPTSGTLAGREPTSGRTRGGSDEPRLVTGAAATVNTRFGSVSLALLTERGLAACRTGLETTLLMGVCGNDKGCEL